MDIEEKFQLIYKLQFEAFYMYPKQFYRSARHRQMA